MIVHTPYRTLGDHVAACMALGCKWHAQHPSRNGINREAVEHAKSTGHRVQVGRSQFKLVTHREPKPQPRGRT